MKREMWFAMGMMLGLVACAVEPVQDPRVTDDTEVGVSRQDIGGGSCASHDQCYCFCRVDHPCFLNPSQCGPLGACLTSCDHQYPGSCPDNGPQFPRTRFECL